jgi:hypothetical protein
LTVSLNDNTTTKIIQNKSLMSLGETQLPRKTGILDTSPARGTSTAVVTGDENVVSLGLSDTRGDNTNADLGYQLYRNTSAGVRALEIINELLQILNGVDVVMRRWRN